MGLQEKFSLLSHIAKKAIFGNENGKTLQEKWEEKNMVEVDKNLPLGLKIGSVIGFDYSADLLLSEESPTFLFKANEEKYQVIAIGKIAIANINLIRFYLQGMNSNDMVLLEVSEQSSKILTICMYKNYDTLGIVKTHEEPVTENGLAALNFWIEGTEPMIGAPNFSIFDDNGEEHIFDRVREPQLMKPIIDNETELLYDTSKDKDVENVKHKVCYYHRTLDNLGFNGKELNMVRLSESEKGASIEIFVGVELKELQVKIY